MSGTKDLRDLLNRIRSEVPPQDPESPLPDKGLGPQPARPAAPPQRRFETTYRAHAPQEPDGPGNERRPNHAWSENKEIMLFGMLSSLIAALGGILAGLDYLVMTGTVLFGIFSLVTCVTLLRSGAVPMRSGHEERKLVERVDALSKRMETLSSRAVSGGVRNVAAAADPELERKVEELRTMVKSLRKAAGLE